MEYTTLAKKITKTQSHLTVSESQRLADSVTEYVRLREQIKELEAKLKPVSENIKKHAKSTKDGLVLIAGYHVSLTPTTREVLSLSDVRLAFEPEFFEKHITPLIKLSKYDTLKVTEIGSKG